MRYFDGVQNAWNAKRKEWEKAGFRKSIVDKIDIHKKKFDVELEKEKLLKYDVKYLAKCDKKFPVRLKEIVGCPIGLFCRGEMLQVDEKAIAVVGTRKVTSYGREVTEQFVEGLVDVGFTIVSGLALGVDVIAHRSALSASGRTIAVLGHGLDMTYPVCNQKVAVQIIEDGQGSIVSEFPIGVNPVPQNFPARNRIVSGMSLGVLVTEGASKSGSKITAMMAVEQNREVFAVPGQINNPMAAAPGDLIKMGAKLVMNVGDVLEEFGCHDGRNEMKKNKNEKPEVDFGSDLEEKIWDILGFDGIDFDEMVRVLKISAAELTGILTMMELKGIVSCVGDGKWKRK